MTNHSDFDRKYSVAFDQAHVDGSAAVRTHLNAHGRIVVNNIYLSQGPNIFNQSDISGLERSMHGVPITGGLDDPDVTVIDGEFRHIDAAPLTPPEK